MILAKVVCTSKGHLMATVTDELSSDAETIEVALCRCYVEPEARMGRIYGEPNELQRDVIASERASIPAADVRAEIAAARARGKLPAYMRVRFAPTDPPDNALP